MTTLLLGYCIIHDFLITQAILNSEDHISVGVCLIVSMLMVRKNRETAGGTTVYPKLYISYVW